MDVSFQYNTDVAPHSSSLSQTGLQPKSSKPVSEQILTASCTHYGIDIARRYQYGGGDSILLFTLTVGEASSRCDGVDDVYNFLNGR